MVIVSQDYKGTHDVQKRIVNFGNIQYLMIDIMVSGEALIIFKDNTMKEENLKKCNCILGIYNTKERAKEVLYEIIEKYRAICEDTYFIVYEMPED